MPNITVTISEAAYHEARVWAASNDTSVSAVVEYCLEHLPRLPVARQALSAAGAKPSPAGCEPTGKDKP